MKKKVTLLVTLFMFFIGIGYGQNWETLNTNTTNRIYDMSIPPGQNDIVYAATGSGLFTGEGTIIKTVDGGDTWTQIYPTSGTSVILRSIFFTSVDTGYVGGLDDTVLKTTDGGSTWTDISFSVAGDIFHTIKFIDANHGITVANPMATASSTIYVTDDAGATWTQATGLTHGVYDLTYSDENLAFAVGHQNQSISRSTDGGYSWSVVNTGSFTFFLLGVDFVGDYGVAVGQFGDIYYTSDAGETWTYNNSINTSYNYEGIHVFNSDSTIFGGMQEKMYKTTDGGVTWVIEYDGPNENHFYDIEFSENNTGFAGLSNGKILRKPAPAASSPELSVTPNPYVFDDTFIDETTSADFTFANTGTEVLNITDITFTNPAFSIDYTAFPIQPGESGDLPVHFTPDSEGLFEGTMQIWSNDPVNNPYEVELSGNGIIELIDGWQWIETGFNYILMDIEFPEGQNQVGYSIGQSLTYNGVGIVIKTTDSGLTWTQLTPDGIPGLEEMSFVDMQTGYAAGWDDYVIKTTDGGATWDTLTVATGMWEITDIEFYDADHGILLEGANVYLTEDGGETWTAGGGLVNSGYMVDYLDANTLIVVGNENYIYKTTDGGLNWSVKNSGNIGQLLLGVDFLNDQYGMAAGDYGYIFKTTDGGDSWTSTTQVGDNLLRTPFIWDEDTAWVCGTPELVYKTTNGGTNWNSAYNGNYQKAFYRILFTDNYTGFICGGSGGIVLRKEGLLSAPELMVTPNPYVFDDTFVGETTNADFTFENTGTEVLNITDITFTNSAFSIDYTAFPIQPGESGDLPVHFTPDSQGLFEGTMQIWSDDPFNNPYNVELSGNGIVELIDGWQWIETGFNYILMDVQFPEGQNQVGYTVGQSLTYNGVGIVLKTTDSGGTWTQMTPDGIPGLTGMSFLDMNTGYAIGWDDYVIKTTDGGITWETLIYATGTWSFYYDIEFFDEDKGVILAGIDVYVTNDGGDTWTMGNGITYSCTMIEYASETTLFAVGNEDHIYKSTDGGYTWTLKNTAGTGTVLLGVDFLNDQYGMAAGDYGHIYKTTDGGETWTLNTQVGDNLLHTPFIWNEDTAWICGTPELVYKSTNGGTNWNSAYNGNYQRAFYRIMFTENYTGFISSSGGVILRKEGLAEIPAINVSPLAVNFEDTYVGESTSEVITITNIGLATLDVTNITSTNDAFTIDITSLMIEPGSDQDITITFTPDDEGLFEGMVQIESNDPAANQVDVLVSGTGMIAYPSINVDPIAIVFDTTLVNEISAETITIGNNGMAVLDVTNITSSSSVFTIDQTTFSIDPGNSQDVVVSFAPDQQMLFSGVIEIESNDPNGTVEIDLEGYGDIETSAGNNLYDLIKIYPNPTMDFLTIDNAKDNEICIFDLLGNVKYKSNASDNTLRINVSDFKNGIYLIRLVGQDGMITRKFEVNK